MQEDIQKNGITLLHLKLTSYSPPLWRVRSLEEALNVLLCLVRGELPSSTRGPVRGRGRRGLWSLGSALFPQKRKMCRNVAGADFPLEEAVGGEAEEGARVDVASGIATEYLTGVGVHGNAVGFHDGGFGAVGDEVGGEDLTGAGVDDAIVCLVLHSGVGELRTYYI